jgi:hypothetical protein
MGWIYFAHFIEHENSNAQAWAAAIKNNPNNAPDALKVAISEQIVKPKSMENLDKFCRVVVDLALRAHLVQKAAWELCDELYGSDTKTIPVELLPEEVRLKAHALLATLGDDPPW